MRKLAVFTIFTFAPLLALAQPGTTKDNYKGSYSSPLSWKDGSTQNPASVPSTSGVNYNIKGYINVGAFGSPVDLSFSQTNDAYNFTVSDTLVIYGNLLLANKAMNLIVPTGGVLIVLGNLTSDNQITLEDGGIIVIKGTATFNGGNGQNNYVNDGGKFWPIGGLAGSHVDTDATTAATNSGNFNSVAPTSLVNFINNLGQFSLPIELTFFKSEILANEIKLDWSTSSEINFDYFTLERSGDGKVFDLIVKVKGHGTTNERHDYSFKDNFPLIGKNYYRLTSVDFDNYKETFKVIVQDYSTEKEFQVSPNPSDGQAITLSFNFDSKEGLVVIYDSMGSIVDSFQVSEKGKVTFANTLKEGIYFVKYSSPSFTKAIRFLVKQ